MGVSPERSRDTRSLLLSDESEVGTLVTTVEGWCAGAEGLQTAERGGLGTHKIMLLLLSHFSRVDSVRPQRRQPTRLPCPWDSPGKNTGVGCHFLLQSMKVKSEGEVAQSCPTLRNPMDCSLPSSSIHGIFPGKSTGVGCHCLLRKSP